MSNKSKTYVAIVLDRSGSMGSSISETIQGFNEQVQQIKENAKESEIYTSLITFNGNIFEHFWNQPAAELQETNGDDYNPSGSTAMRDAVGYTVEKLMETTDHEDKNNAYLVIIISDGYENTSTHYSIDALKEIIESCQETDRWTFTYMGCDEGYVEEISHQTSIPVSNMAVCDYNDSTAVLRAYTNSSAKLGLHLSGVARGMMSSTNYFSQDDSKAADFTKLSEGVTPEGVTPPTTITSTSHSGACTATNTGSSSTFGSSKRVSLKNYGKGKTGGQ